MFVLTLYYIEVLYWCVEHDNKLHTIIRVQKRRHIHIIDKFCFFSVRLLSVLRGHSVFSSPPQRPMTSNFEGFSIPDFNS